MYLVATHVFYEDKLCVKPSLLSQKTYLRILQEKRLTFIQNMFDLCFTFMFLKASERAVYYKCLSFVFIISLHSSLLPLYLKFGG